MITIVSYCWFVLWCTHHRHGVWCISCVFDSILEIDDMGLYGYYSYIISYNRRHNTQSGHSDITASLPLCYFSLKSPFWNFFNHSEEKNTFLSHFFGHSYQWKFSSCSSVMPSAWAPVVLLSPFKWNSHLVDVLRMAAIRKSRWHNAIMELRVRSCASSTQLLFHTQEALKKVSLWCAKWR